MFSLDSTVCVSVLSLCCKVGQVCEEVVRVPLINMAWEQALAIWGQYSMSANEHRRWMLTHTFHSSTVRATTAAHKLLKVQVHTYKQKQIFGYTVQAHREFHISIMRCVLYLTCCLSSYLLLDYKAERCSAQ